MSLFRALRSSVLEAPPSREATQRPLVLADGVVVPLVQVRDRRARRLRLTVSERGVRLSVPWRVSERVADAFVSDHAAWIAEQWMRFRDVREPTAWAFGAVDVLPLGGESLPVQWVEARRACLERIHDDEPASRMASTLPPSPRLRFHAPRQASPAVLRRALLDFYDVEARAAIHRWLPAYLPGLPRPPREFRVRALSSLWGSLAPDGTVSLDLSLALGPPAAFEYVLVHELCHLIHANHSAAFWREVERRCPDWREVRTFLRSDGGLGLKAQLRALTKA